MGAEPTGGEGMRSRQLTEAQGQGAADFSQANTGMKDVGLVSDGHHRVVLPSRDEDPPQPPTLMITCPSVQATPNLSSQEIRPTPGSFELTWGLGDISLLMDCPSNFEWPETEDQETSSAENWITNPQDQTATQPRPDAFAQPSDIGLTTGTAGPSSHLPVHEGLLGQVDWATWEQVDQVAQDLQLMFPSNTPARGSQTPTLPEPGSEFDLNHYCDFDDRDTWNGSQP